MTLADQKLSRLGEPKGALVRLPPRTVKSAAQKSSVFDFAARFFSNAEMAAQSSFKEFLIP